MKYCITMERTQRIAVSFEAPDDEAAEKEAAKINQTTKPEDFEQGEMESDYALCNTETGQTVLDWD